MKRCLAVLLSALILGNFSNAQLINNGATISVQSGATIKCTGSIINNSGGIIQNAGTVSSDGEVRNQVGGTLSGTGTFEATTKFINSGNAFAGLNLKLIGNVNTDSIKSAGGTFANVNMAKGAGTSATLSDAMIVTGNFTFENDDNRLILEDENLVMGAAANFVSADDNEFVQTNYAGTTSNVGVVTKQGLGATGFLYPVGFGPGQYNPVSVSNTGTSDNISVRCMQNVLDQGLSGSPVTSHFVNNSWVVSEDVAGGSNLQLSAVWSAADELAPFNRNKVGIARYNTGIDWDLPASNVLSASGSSPTFNSSRSNITSTGVFAVADLEKVNAARLNLRVLLQGAYNVNNGTMNDGLRALNLIPTTQPYSSAMSASFTRVGVYDGTPSVNETVPGTTVFDVTGTDNDIVDWVYLSLQDGTTPATKLQTRAALVQRDGDIVEYDPITASFGPVRMPIDADGNYHLIIAHRNHLPIRTPVAQLLQDNTIFTYDFSDAQAKAYQNPTVTSNAAMKNFGNGRFGMWGGNVDLSTSVKFTGPPNDAAALLSLLGGNQATILNSQYNRADVDMNGTVRFTGPPNDAAALLAFIGGIQSTIINQHL